MTFRPLPALFAALVLGLAGCATHVDLAPDAGQPALRVQQRLALTPSNGGLQISPDDLRAGDIVLSSTHSLVSMGVRLITVAPVSHAALYLGDGQFVEAVGAGVRLRSTQEYMDGESTIVAFRHPGVGDEHIAALNAFARQHAGKKYNTAGIVLQAPFSIGRQYCELPLIPGLVRDYCIRGLAAIQLGAIKNDRFFCSQFVLEAYRHAKLPLTTADPRLQPGRPAAHARRRRALGPHGTDAAIRRPPQDSAHAVRRDGRRHGGLIADMHAEQRAAGQTAGA